MDRERSAFFTIVVIAAVIVVFAIADLVQGDRLFPQSENRVLASKPAFSWEELLWGDYTGDYEAYLTDRFVGRDKWIAIKTYMDIALQKKEIRGVYLGADGYLIEQHLPEEYSAVQETKKIALLERLVWEWDATVMLVPTADNILTDKLPAYASYYDQTRLLRQVESRIGPEHYVDVYSVLQEHTDEEIYYRTDYHWTSLGAAYAYQAWAEGRFEEVLDYREAEMEAVTEDFLGTLHSKVNLDMTGEAIYYFPNTVQQPVTVTYDLMKTTDTLYEESYLDTKNKYGFFLDDNHGFVEIDTGYHTGRELFIIKDSYANCFIPLLLPHYEKVYVIDLRYFNGRLFRFMDGYKPDDGMDVLLLYNCIHFLEDFSYVE